MLASHTQTSCLFAGDVLTKHYIKSRGCFAMMLPYLWSKSLCTLLYALLAVQNTCIIDPEFPLIMERQGANERLFNLCESADPRIVGSRVPRDYASNCLANVLGAFSLNPAERTLHTARPGSQFLPRRAKSSEASAMGVERVPGN